jgi:hypothetical protein
MPGKCGAKMHSQTNLIETAVNTLQELPFETITSTASYIIYSSIDGLISEHTRPSDAIIAFFQYASKQVKAGGGPLPGIYKRALNDWRKI